MLNQVERWILHYDTVIVPFPREAPNIPMREVIPRVALLQARRNVSMILEQMAARV